MIYPKIYLAADNCFALKRWTRPSEWMRIMKEAGLNFAEAGADNECDPFHADAEYFENWTDEIQRYSEITGVRVANLYSGHSTYATLGLAHDNRTIQKRFLNDWLGTMMKIACKADAGMGFFCHAFPDSVLQRPEAYRRAERELYGKLAELAVLWNGSSRCLSVEQMYTPHQIPWTIQGAADLLKKVYRRSKKAFYLTIDTGHQSGQRKFLRPDRDRIAELIEAYRSGARADGMWLGSESTYALFRKAVEEPPIARGVFISKIETEMDKFPYLFSSYEDGDPYLWMEALGCYSPIIHLQQTTGSSSAHLPFTREWNENGIIAGDKVLRAILAAYESEEPEDMPPRCEEIYLTLEIFSGTADINTDIRYRLHESVKYWRRFIPEDGLRLDELLDKLQPCKAAIKI